MPPESPDESKKYIRTFASDVAALQGTNIKKEEPPKPVPPIVPPPVITLPSPPPRPVFVPPPPPKPLPTPPAQQPPPPPRFFVPPQQPVRTPLPPKPTLPTTPAVPKQPPIPPTVSGGENSPIHTYSSDFSERVKEEHASTATLLAAEGDNVKTAPELWKKPDRTSLFYVIGGVALLVIGGAVATLFYVNYLSKTAPVILAPTVTAPIFVDSRQQISGTGSQLMQQVLQSVANPLGMTAVRLLYTNESVAGTSTIFSALNLPAPDELTRNINEQSGMAGVINVNGVQSPFFIISVSSYADTFAAMLSWEPLMPQNLSLLFPPYPAPVVATTTMATTTLSVKGKKPTKVATTTPPAPVYVAGFDDEVIANHDTRVYRDSQNRIVFLYGYWDPSTLIIARDNNAFTEIINRLGNSQTH